MYNRTVATEEGRVEGLSSRRTWATKKNTKLGTNEQTDTFRLLGRPERTILRLIMAAYGDGSLGLSWVPVAGKVEYSSEWG